MTKKTLVTFKSNTPDDTVFSDTGDVVVPAGGALAEILSKSFSQNGFSVTEVRQFETYGWHFNVVIKNYDIHFILQFADNYLLIIEYGSLVLRFINLKNPSPLILKEIDDVLKSIPDIIDVKWHEKRQYEAGTSSGSSVP